MPSSKAQAIWEGGLKSGKGQFSAGSGAFSGAYSFATRFEGAKGTNPEELIAAAHAGCFSMALAGALSRVGTPPTSVKTNASVHLDKGDNGFAISRIDLDTEVDAPGLDPDKFQEAATGAKANCPVSQALSAVEITLNARLA